MLKLRDTKKKKSCIESQEVKKTILNEHFWAHGTNFQELVAPMVFGLCDFDAKMPCMGKVLHIMRNLEKHVFAL